MKSSHLEVVLRDLMTTSLLFTLSTDFLTNNLMMQLSWFCQSQHYAIKLAKVRCFNCTLGYIVTTIETYNTENIS